MVDDSSGATIAVETLLWLTDPAPALANGAPQPRQVQAAVGFSTWLDLTDSSSDYHARRYCGSDCEGVGSMTFRSLPGVGQLKAMCDAKRGLDEGLPSFCLHSCRMYGESL